MNGWIKIHRALSEHHVASDPHSLSVWIHMLMLANHRECKRQINGRILVVLPGQLITSRKSLADKTGVNESKVERVLKMLQNEQLIEQHGTSKFRVISIVNWAKYQTDEQQDEQQVNSKRTAGEQQMNTPEEIPYGIKNGKKVKNTPTQSEKDADGERFETFWKLYPKKVSKAAAIKAWAKLKQSDMDQAMQALPSHCMSSQWTKDGGQFIPNAATWLNARRWEDEIRPAGNSGLSKHNGFSGQRDYEKGLHDNGDGTLGF